MKHPVYGGGREGYYIYGTSTYVYVYDNSTAIPNYCNLITVPLVILYLQKFHSSYLTLLFSLSSVSSLCCATIYFSGAFFFASSHSDLHPSIFFIGQHETRFYFSPLFLKCSSQLPFSKHCSSLESNLWTWIVKVFGHAEPSVLLVASRLQFAEFYPGPEEQVVVEGVDPGVVARGHGRSNAGSVRGQAGWFAYRAVADVLRQVHHVQTRSYYQSPDTVPELLWSLACCGYCSFWRVSQHILMQDLLDWCCWSFKLFIRFYRRLYLYSRLIGALIISIYTYLVAHALSTSCYHDNSINILDILQCLELMIMDWRGASCFAHDYVKSSSLQTRLSKRECPAPLTQLQVESVYL